MKIDLHTHTIASDGKLSGKELVDYCADNNIKIIGITDHDSVGSLKEAIDYGKETGVEVVGGIEISCDEEFMGNNEIHIVGLFVDYSDKALIDLVNWQNKQREIQKKKIIEKLNKLGYKISFEELVKEAKGAGFGRPHIARIISRKYPSEFPDPKGVFDKGLLSNGGKAYVKKKKLSMKYAIDAIRQSGGISILAHPGLCFDKDDKTIEMFKELGGNGLEVDYCYHGIKGVNEKDIPYLLEKYNKIASENHLLVSGGSDFHEFKLGFPKPGDYGISEDEFGKLKRR